VPLPEMPAIAAVPYSVLPDESVINPVYGKAPSLLVKLGLYAAVKHAGS